MSPWLRSSWLVTLSPSEVTLRPIERARSLRGIQPTVGEPRTHACGEPDGTPAWRPAIGTLEAAMSQLPGRRAAIVVLSNQFVRYAIVPWREELAAGEEEKAWTRHCFTRLYGSAAAQWDIRLNPLPLRGPRLACAVDAELIEALRAQAQRSDCVLHSVQPHLVAAFNSSRRQLGRCSAWVALPEQGYMCLALLGDGQWLRIRGARIEGRWQDELLGLLEREAYLESGSVPHEVYVWSSQADELDLPQWDSWRLQSLAPNELPMAG